MTAATSRGADWWHAASRFGRLGWRARVLLGIALLACVASLALSHRLAQVPHLDLSLQPAGKGDVELVASRHRELQGLPRRVVRAIESDVGGHVDVDSALLLKAPRWILGDDERTRAVAQQSALAELLRAPTVTLVFANRDEVRLTPLARGLAGLGVMYWLVGALSLMLFMAGAVVLLWAPGAKNVLYAVASGWQGLNLLLIAVESLPGLGLPAGIASGSGDFRTLCDVCTGAAVLHGCLVHPHALRRSGWLAGAGWAIAFGYAIDAVLRGVAHQWWWTQSLTIGYGVATLAVLTWSHRHEPNPASLVLRRLCLAATGTLALLTLAGAAADGQPQTQLSMASIGSLSWYVFFASLLLLVPFMSRAQHVMREFAMLAGLSTVASSLHLLFVSVFALDPFASLTLAMFASLGLYAGVRQWTLSHLVGSGAMSAERTFDSLHRAVRAIEATPQHTPEHLTRLLHELFEPLEIGPAPRAAHESAITANGSMLSVPLPALPGTPESAELALFLRYARRGRSLFTIEDARLADRVLEQLRSALAYDRAVEQGRNEERTRLAQDLHDDIGARLLTLMYKAPDPEMEEYVRHTLQDLKTLTRGLATRDHLLSEAAVEWKADIAQRLAASHCDLTWAFHADRDMMLGVVQWSALTRILRELVNNVIAHTSATQVDISATYAGGELTLRVSDDGNGRAPHTWSHGLGLGGVRKRAKVLGGNVQWRERDPRGIVCEVVVPHLGEAPK